MANSASGSTYETNLALQSLTKTIKALEGDKSESSYSRILEQWLSLAKQTTQIGNIASLKLLLSLLRSLLPSHPSWELYLHRYLAKIALIEGLYPQATTLLEKVLTKAKEQNNLKQIIEAELDLAEAYLVQNRYDETEKLLKNAFEVSHQQRYYLFYVRALNRLARLCYFRRNWDTSQLYLEQVNALISSYPNKDNLDKETQIELELEEAFAHQWQGAILTVKRQWAAGVELLEATLKVYYRYQHLLGIVETMLNLSAVYQQLEQHPKALICIEGSQAICEQLHCLPLSMQAYYYKAIHFYVNKQYLEASNEAYRATEIGNKLKQTDWLARACYVMGRSQAKLGDTKAALKNLLQVIDIYGKSGDANPQWIDVLIGTGDFLLSLPDQPTYWEQGLDCYLWANDLIEFNQQLEYLAPALGSMARAFLKVKGLDGIEEAARCYRLELQLAGDLESTVLPIAVSVALRVEALTGIQCCAALRSNPNFDGTLERLIRQSAVKAEAVLV